MLSCKCTGHESVIHVTHQMQHHFNTRPHAMKCTWCWGIHSNMLVGCSGQFIVSQVYFHLQVNDLWACGYEREGIAYCQSVYSHFLSPYWGKWQSLDIFWFGAQVVNNSVCLLKTRRNRTLRKLHCEAFQTPHKYSSEVMGIYWQQDGPKSFRKMFIIANVKVTIYTTPIYCPWPSI